MNRAERRATEKVCRREGHLTKTDGHGEWLPFCVRCGATVEKGSHPSAGDPS